MKRTATAHWAGTLRDGQGQLSAPSGVLKQTNYSFKTRFEEGVQGTNPEELLVAAHAGCFTMAVCAILGQQNITPSTLDTEATLTMENLTVTSIHLKITGVVPGITAEQFAEVVKGAELNCVISKALKVPITSEAVLA